MSDIRETEIKIHSIGSQALDVLNTKEEGIVFGKTSRGIFLNFDNEKMIFITFEKYPGPLTVNLPEDISFVSKILQGEIVTTSRNKIFFSDSGICTSTLNAKVWNPPFPTEVPLSFNERIELIRQLSREAYNEKKSTGFSEMLPFVIGFDSEILNSGCQMRGIFEEISSLKKHLAKGNWNSLPQSILSFLGMGSGLTPSGDDFVIGLLLVLNRWKSLFQPEIPISALNQNVVETAYHSTTTLSASLIECAALGLADERLIRTVDFLATGNNHQNDIISVILSWGNSSGVDALVGMITAFQASKSF